MSVEDEPDDEALLSAWANGHGPAFDQLYDRWAPRVTGYATRLVGRREDAEEICVEAFVRVLERRWRPDGSFRGWLFTVVHRACVDRLRRRALTERILAAFGAGSPAEVASPEGALLVDERARRVERALGRLPPEHRAILLLSASQGLPARELGQVLGKSDQQIRSQLSYARRLLRERLGEDP